MYVELAIGRAGQANGGLGQNRAGPKLARFFRAKILTAQPALKIGLVGSNSLLKAKKIRAGQAGQDHTRLGHIGPGQIWPDFFRVNNLMAQPDPNSRRTGLAHQTGSILPSIHGVGGRARCGPRGGDATFLTKIDKIQQTTWGSSGAGRTNLSPPSNKSIYFGNI